MVDVQAQEVLIHDPSVVLKHASLFGLISFMLGVAFGFDFASDLVTLAFHTLNGSTVYCRPFFYHTDG